MRDLKGILRGFYPGDGRDNKKEPEPSGFEQYKRHCEQMLAEFRQKFDPNDKTKSQDIYDQAKRLSRIIEGAVQETAYSGIFYNSSSGLGEAPKNRLTERYKRAQSAGANINIGLEKIRETISIITNVVNGQTLENEKGHIIPLSRETGEEFDSVVLPGTESYAKQLKSNIESAKSHASDLADTHGTPSIIRKEDLQALSGAYRSLILDRDLWQAVYEDVMSTDPKVYNGGFLNNLDNIRFDFLGTICDTFERAYSEDGISESDMDSAWLLGATTKTEAQGSIIPENFVEQKTFFQILGIDPEKLIGKTEEELQKELRRAYYREAKECHPDLHPNDERKKEEFLALDKAYKTLSDPIKRKRYIEDGD